MQVIASVDVDIKLNGVFVPFNLIIVNNLAYPVILGMSFLSATRAVVDVSTHRLSIFDGLTSIPLMLQSTPSIRLPASTYRLALKPYSLSPLLFVGMATISVNQTSKLDVVHLQSRVLCQPGQRESYVPRSQRH